MIAATELAQKVGVKPACAALGVPRATFYRRRGSNNTGPQQPRPTPARALSSSERDEVHAVLCSERFVDRSPAEVVATLLDEGQYLCSERTMYRILAERAEVRDRRNQLRHPPYRKPELVARAPNEVWSWDITRLLGPKKWNHYYLYVVLDIYSRYVVGWMVADRENASLAGRLISETCTKYGVHPDVLTLHSDRGSPMTAKCTAQLLADLGVTQSLSRPRVSDDNPYSEAQFKTLKYHPSFPGRFDSIEDAQRFCRSFFPWYNDEHRHGGIAMLSPATVHAGLAKETLAGRQKALEAAYQAHPERFPNGRPRVRQLKARVWINAPENDGDAPENEGGGQRPQDEAPKALESSSPSASPLTQSERSEAGGDADGDEGGRAGPGDLRAGGRALTGISDRKADAKGAQRPQAVGRQTANEADAKGAQRPQAVGRQTANEADAKGAQRPQAVGRQTANEADAKGAQRPQAVGRAVPT